MKKVMPFLCTILIFLLMTTGCVSQGLSETPPSFTVDGAVVTTSEGSTSTLRAYSPTIRIVFDTKEKKLPTKASLIVTNIAGQTIKTHGLAPTSVEVISSTSARYNFTLPPGKSETVTFLTTTTNTFQFAVIGDNRDGRKIYLQLLETLNTVQPAFVINGGDLVSTGEQTEYTQFLSDSARLNMPYYTALGNHDIGGNGRSTYNRLIAPNFYDIIWGNSHILILDNADGNVDADQLAWLEDKLKTRVTKHVFLVMHKPPFDPRPGKAHTVNTRALGDKLIELAAKYQVTAVFSSHIHILYQGTRLGIPYYITGGAGAPLYAEHSAGGLYHFIHVKVDGDRVDITPVELKGNP